MDLLTVKIIAMLLMGGFAIFFGLLPLKIKSMVLKGDEQSRTRRKREFIISGLLCFGAGVLIATVFIHMIPETREGFELAKKMAGSKPSSAHSVQETETSHVSHVVKKLDHELDHINEGNRSGEGRSLPLNENDKKFHGIERANHHVHGEHDHGIGDHMHGESNIHGLRAYEDHDVHVIIDPDYELLGNDSTTKAIIRPVADFKLLGSTKSPRDDDASGNRSRFENIEHDAANRSLGSTSPGNEFVTTSSQISRFQEQADTRLKDSVVAHEHGDHDHVHENHNNAVSEHKEPIQASDEKHKTNEVLLDSFPMTTDSFLHSENSEDVTGIESQTNSIENKIANDGSTHTLKLEGAPKFEALTHNHDHSHEDHNHEHGHSDHHEHHDHSEDHHDYPLAELFICLGFFLIYILEEVMHKVLLRPSADGSEKKTLLNKTSGEDVEECGHTHLHNYSHTHPHTVGNADCNSRGKSSSSNGHVMETKNMSPRSEWRDLEGVDNPVFAGDVDATSWNPNVKNSVMISQNKVAPVSSQEAPKSYGTSSEAPSAPEPLRAEEEANKSLSSSILSNIRALLIVIALSFHGVFEGMAVGLQERKEDVWYLFLAISAHHFVLAFCVGMEFLVVGTPLFLFILYMLVLGLVNPFGIGVGIIITESFTLNGAGHYYAITILQGIAGGTLLYVAFLEILERERSKKGGRLIKLFCVVLGFAAMSSLEAIAGGHSHAPSEMH